MTQPTYFNKLGKIEFEGQTLPDYFFGYKVPEEFYSTGYFTELLVNDDMAPEDVSHYVYKTDRLWWLVLLYNNIMDPFYDWPMDSDTLELYAEKVTEQRYNYNYSMAEYTIVFDELFLVNEDKRRIQLPLPESVEHIIEDVDRYLSKIIGR